MAQVLSRWQYFRTFLHNAASWIVDKTTVGNFFALISLLVFLGIAVLIFQDLNRDVAIIEPIAVPKALADSGYTPEVAGHRLRDALDALQQLVDAEPESSLVDETNAANSILAHNVAARDALPDFVVPQIGLSLSAIVSSIRSVLHYTKGGNVISGELIYRDRYALRVRIDGREVFTSGFDSDNPDDLLDRAAPVIVTKLWPALGAAVLYRTNPDQALRDVEDIIANFKESDPNVPGAYILWGDDLSQHANYGEAEKKFRKAISLNWSTWSVYNRLGLALQRQRQFQEALVQFRQVVRINPSSAEGYVNIGAALFQLSRNGDSVDKAKLDEARESYNHAIKLRPHDVGAQINLGLVWNLERDPENAMQAFRRAIEIDPNNPYGHWNLAAVLADQNEYDAALAEYRITLDCTQDARNLALLHIHIGNTLKAKAGANGNLDAAIAEYRRAIEIDPFYAWTHNSLGEVLREQGKLDEAIAEFNAALQTEDPEAMKAAKDNLEEAKQAKAKEPTALKEEAQAATK